MCWGVQVDVGEVELIVYNEAIVYKCQNFFKVVVHVIIIDH